MQRWFLSVTAINRLMHSSTRRSVLTVVYITTLLLLWLPGTAVQAQTSSVFGNTSPQFLAVDEAFRFYTSLDSNQQLSIHWQIAPGYYLYADKFSLQVMQDNQPVATLNAELPPGTAHYDEYFGDVEVFYEALRMIVGLPEHLDQSFTLQIGFQGCAEAGLCYPPTLRTTEIFR